MLGYAAPGQTPPWADTPLGIHCPNGQTPPSADTPAKTHPGRHPQADTPWVDTLWADTPLGRHPQADTPQADTPLTRRLLLWTVRILLECILVASNEHN